MPHREAELMILDSEQHRISNLSRRHFVAALTTASVMPLVAMEAREESLISPGSERGVLDLDHSSHAKLKTIPIGALEIRNGFWASRRTTNTAVSLPTMHDQMEHHGRFDNYRRWDGKRQAYRNDFHSNNPPGLRQGADSEVYKWLEAIAFALQSNTSPELKTTADRAISIVLGAQEPSGYLDTYFVGDKIDERMLPTTQMTGHEIYCLGHLLMAGIAYYRATGDRALLNAGIRFFDKFLIPQYGPGASQKPLLSGHPGSEMALVELYRTTSDRRYLDLAAYLLKGDERIPLERSGSVHYAHIPFTSTYMFSGIPFTSRTKLAGHAVRALYACCGAADYYLETGDPEYRKALDTLWQDLVTHKMYVTGAVGVLNGEEAFGDPYELPNERAYAESCASIGNMMWNWRLLCASGETRFADTMERVLYNGVNSGMSLDGESYCYRNPLSFDPASGTPSRKEWWNVNCCPPNLERTFASLPGYFYSTSEDGIWVHLYDNSTLNWQLTNGNGVTITQKTNYPWDGDVELTIVTAQPTEFTLYVRIPGWSKFTKANVKGAPVDDVRPATYLPIHRRWSGTETVSLHFDMTPQILAATGRVESDARRVAIQRGPLVYCMEQIDQEPAAAMDAYSIDLNGVATDRIKATYEPSLLGGVTVLRAPGQVDERTPTSSDQLYRSIEVSPARSKSATLTLIPYYAWANREPCAMQVWIPYVRRDRV